jgi:hypothetical protein
MAIKILMLKSGEDIICDVSNMGVEVEGKQKVIGYYMTKPCTFEGEPSGEPNCYNIKLKAWTPLVKDTIVPITAEWVITILDPIDDLAKMYHSQVLAPQSVAEWRGQLDNMTGVSVADIPDEEAEKTNE